MLASLFTYGRRIPLKIISAVLYIPVYPFIATVAVGFVVLCLVLLAEFLSLLGEVISEWTR